MPTLPQPTHRLARPRRHQLRLPSRPLIPPRQLTRAPRDLKPTINQRGPEKPLRDEKPPRRQHTIPDRASQLLRREDEPRGTIDAVQEEEEEEGDGGPEPVYLDEVDVYQVPLQGEVAGRLVGRVGLRERVVGRVAGGWVDEGEEGAEKEGGGVEGEEEGFEGGGEERVWEVVGRIGARCCRGG